MSKEMGLWWGNNDKGKLNNMKVSKILQRFKIADTQLEGIAHTNTNTPLGNHGTKLGHKVRLTMLQSRWVGTLATVQSNSVCRCHPTVAWSHWPSHQEGCPAPQQLQTERRAAGHHPAGGDRDTWQGCYNKSITAKAYYDYGLWIRLWMWTIMNSSTSSSTQTEWVHKVKSFEDKIQSLCFVESFGQMKTDCGFCPPSLILKFLLAAGTDNK